MSRATSCIRPVRLGWRACSRCRIQLPSARRVCPMSGLLTNAGRSYHFDVRQFHRMMAAGIFDDQKVELVAGKIYAMSDRPPHTFAVGRFHEELRAVLPRDEWTIREE